MNEQPTYLEIFKDLRKEKESAFYGVEVFDKSILDTMVSIIEQYYEVRIVDEKTINVLGNKNTYQGQSVSRGVRKEKVIVKGLVNKSIAYNWHYQSSMPLCHSSQIRGEYDTDRIETNIAILKGVPNIDFVDTELCIKVDGVLWNVVLINGDVALV